MALSDDPCSDACMTAQDLRYTICGSVANEEPEDQEEGSGISGYEEEGSGANGIILADVEIWEKPDYLNKSRLFWLSWFFIVYNDHKLWTLIYGPTISSTSEVLPMKLWLFYIVFPKWEWWRFRHELFRDDFSVLSRTLLLLWVKPGGVLFR